MPEDIRKNRRRFDRQFKEDAVALVRGGRSQTQVARDLGVSSGMLSTWVQKVLAGETLPESRSVAGESPEQREVRRLQQEVDYLREQRDILKKALGICSAQMQMPANASR